MRNIKKIKGFTIVIENVVGSIRRGVTPDGKKWATEMKNEYGFFHNTLGSDGDEVDVFLGSSIHTNFNVYIINQINSDGSFDEHKVMFGFDSVDEATKAYYSNYEKGWNGLGDIVEKSISEFRHWLNNKDKTIHPINKTKMAEQDDGIKVVKLFGEVVEGETLLDLQRQAGDINTFHTLIIEIASPGGSVSEGLEIMVWLDQLSAMGKKIITVVVANSYSIASLIMLAADMRLISKHGEVMVHNPMVPQLEYANANELEEYVVELRNLESMMYDLYQIFTGLEKEQIKSLMDNETYLSPDEAVKNGFADTVIDINKRSFEMAVNLKTEINMSKTLNILNQVIAKVNKADFVNQLYYTLDGASEVEIFQADPSTYKVGDKVNAEDGEVVLSDGAKLSVKGGEIVEIDRAADVQEEPAVEEEAAPVEAPVPGDDQAVIQEVIEDETGTVPAEVIPEDEVTAGQFNEGPAPMAPVEEPVKAKDAMPAKVTEVTESITTKETLATVKPEEMKASSYDEKMMDEDSKMMDEDSKMMDEDSKMMDEEKVHEAKHHYEDRWAAFEDRIAKLEARAEKAEANFKNAKKFEDVATQAIDSIYKNTSSSFEPEAKAQPELKESRGSIFSQMKQKAGLK